MPRTPTRALRQSLRINLLAPILAIGCYRRLAGARFVARGTWGESSPVSPYEFERIRVIDRG